MGSWPHGTILAAVNMHAGETYKHTFYVHVRAHKEFGIEIFVNDVVCLYWPWAISVGQLIPDFAAVTQETKPFLSYVHGQAHDINCRVNKYKYIFLNGKIVFEHFLRLSISSIGRKAPLLWSGKSRNKCFLPFQDTIMLLTKWANQVGIQILCSQMTFDWNILARNDHLSAAMIYSNRRKGKRLPNLITRRLLMVYWSY